MDVSKDLKFNSYEYHLIKKFTLMNYDNICSEFERIKMRNKTSVWHELLTYLQSPKGVLKLYKVEITEEDSHVNIYSEAHYAIFLKDEKEIIYGHDKDPDYIPLKKQNIKEVLPLEVTLELKRKLKAVIQAKEDNAQCSNMPKNLGISILDDPNYIIETLDNYPSRLITFLKAEVNQHIRSLNIPYSTPLSRYLNRYNIVEMHLDHILRSGDDSKLPSEIFYCQNLKVLSLKQNDLRQIPSSIGRLSKLEVLILTDNKLTVQSIPFSLKFCTNLRELYVDDNQLEALPGFLPSMDHLELVYRQGNRNYFKTFFLWYHTDYDHRVRKEIWKNYWIRGEVGSRPVSPSLLDLCAEKIFSSAINFFNEEIPESLKHYMSLTYLNYNICNFCNVATDCSKPGYSTVTFVTPYLGNTCVPFQHWACSLECVRAIEGPGKKLQLEGAKRLDHEYSHYIAKFNKTDEKCRSSKTKRNRCCIS